MISLDYLFERIGTVTIPALKSEVTFAVVDGDVWVSLVEHKPDGSYGEPLQWKLVVSND